MSSETNFETYLLINKKKFILCVIHNTSFETIYSDEMLLSHDSEFMFKKLNEFLEKNIFKVEKILKNFVKNIDIILDNEEFFSVKMSIKENNNGKYIDSKNLLHPLNNLKNSCQSNFNDKKIIHMLIENYLIDDKNYFSLPNNLKCDFFSLDVNFICLSNNFVGDLELILKRYHILVNQILSASYVEKFIDEFNQNIFVTASRIKSGWNENEVSLVRKSYKNKGFFEKFFDFFN
jgi:hypothetical protein